MGPADSGRAVAAPRATFRSASRSNVKLERAVAAGARLHWSDVAYDRDDFAVKVRREMEAAFAATAAPQAASA